MNFFVVEEATKIPLKAGKNYVVWGWKPML